MIRVRIKVFGGIGGRWGRRWRAPGSYRITMGLALEGGRKTSVEVVILLLDDGDDPYRVLSWRSSSDGSAAPQSGRAGLR